MSLDISSQYKTLYSRYKKYQDTNVDNRCHRSSVSLKDLSHFVSMKGPLFDSSDVRLLVVGRATNGWSSLPCETPQEFGDEANRKFNEVGFQWIVNPEDDFYALHNKPAKEEKTYYLKSSPFWRVAYRIWCGLSDSNGEGFIKHIAWTNLFKIAPKDKGNPTDKMCKWQFEACKDVFAAEIKAYRPTHILIITDYDYWYAHPNYNFSGLFEDNQYRGSNYEDKNIFVEATAKIKIEGKLVPVVITCRPEGRKEKAFTKEALKFLKGDSQR